MKRSLAMNQCGTLGASGPGLGRIMAIASLVAAAATVAIVLAGRSVGHSLALGGHSDRVTPIEIVLGNNVLTVPENMIRERTQRGGGELQHLELYLRWPELSGYSDDAAEIFNGRSIARALVFVSIERTSMSRDMSGRYEKIYQPLLQEPGIEGPSGLRLRGFRPEAGYGNELLATSERKDGGVFAARCLAGLQGRQSPAGCERDVRIGKNLSMTYRFPRELLDQWQAMDEALTATISRMIR